jgi:hypothetical protein
MKNFTFDKRFESVNGNSYWLRTYRCGFEYTMCIGLLRVAMEKDRHVSLPIDGIRYVYVGDWDQAGLKKRGAPREHLPPEMTDGNLLRLFQQGGLLAEVAQQVERAPNEEMCEFHCNERDDTVSSRMKRTAHRCEQLGIEIEQVRNVMAEYWCESFSQFWQDAAQSAA